MYYITSLKFIKLTKESTVKHLATCVERRHCGDRRRKKSMDYIKRAFLILASYNCIENFKVYSLKRQDEPWLSLFSYFFVCWATGYFQQ